MRTLLLSLLVLLLASPMNGATIQIAWDLSTTPATNVVGQKVWASVGTASFSVVMNIGPTATTAIVSVSTNSPTRFFVTPYNNSGDAVPSNVVTNKPSVTPPPPVASLNFEAEIGAIASPFYIAGGVVQQDSMTGIANSGRAAWQFTATNAGSYTVNVVLNAPSEGANSVFINIDGEPTDPTMIWDIPVTTAFQSRAAAWRGKGLFNMPEFVPKLWTLSLGPHMLVIRGREGGVQMDKISIQQVAITPPLPPPNPASNLRIVPETP